MSKNTYAWVDEVNTVLALSFGYDFPSFHSGDNPRVRGAVNIVGVEGIYTDIDVVQGKINHFTKNENKEKAVAKKLITVTVHLKDQCCEHL